MTNNSSIELSCPDHVLLGICWELKESFAAVFERGLPIPILDFESGAALDMGRRRVLQSSVLVHADSQHLLVPSSAGLTWLLQHGMWRDFKPWGLHVNGPYFSDLHATLFHDMDSLRVLSLRTTALTHTGLRSLGALRSLRSLHLDLRTQVQRRVGSLDERPDAHSWAASIPRSGGRGLSSLAGLEDLQSVDIDNIGSIDSDLAQAVAVLPRLQSLSLSEADEIAVAEFAAAINASTRLESLAVTSSRIDDDWVQLLDPPPQLEDLDLSGTEVSLEALQTLLRRSSIRSLCVDRCLMDEEVEVLKRDFPGRITSYDAPAEEGS